MKFPEQYRWKNAPNGYGTYEGEPYGTFRIPGQEAKGRALRVIAVDGEVTGWEHASVSLTDSPKKCPSWDEMCIVKRLFWQDSVLVLQFHPPESDYVNNHPGVLHLWRCTSAPFPIPPKDYV